MAVKSFILQPGQFVADGSFVNKFLPLERALNLLNSQAIWFANPETWPDPYEKRFICAKYGTAPFAWKGRVFCTCFTDNATSEASWNAYSKGEICIKLTFNRNELLNVLDTYSANNPHKQVYFDSVEYMQTKNIQKPLTKIPFSPALSPAATIRSMEMKARLLMLKRKAFEYENEFRAVVVKEKATKEKGILIPIPNINLLVSRITIGPTVQDDTYKMLCDLFINKYHFTANQIERSQLYQTLPANIVIRTR